MNIAILTGGISTERAVALRSAKNMLDWAERAGHDVVLYDLPEFIDAFLNEYKKYELIIPVFHGRYGEDGIITGMCETLGIRVAGCPSSVHALCIDKFHTNTIVEKIGIKIPKSWIPGLPLPQKLLPSEGDTSLEKALIIKPNQGGSSLATTKAKTIEEFHTGLSSVNEVTESLTKKRIELIGKSESHFIRHFPSLFDLPLVQECIEGREFTVGVYADAEGTHVLPIIEIITEKGEFFDYEEKYETDGSNEVFSDIDDALKNTLESESKAIYDFLRCRSIVRLDWRYDGENIYFLEVNTIPGFSTASLVPKMWKKAGKSEADFIKMLTY